jgi:hypothetical protein
LSLRRRQFSNGITPALDTAALVGWAADLGDGLASGLGSSAAGLAFGIGHRLVADWLARHVLFRIVTSRNTDQTDFLSCGS